MARRRDNFAGFTLLELVLVLAIIAIVAGMVAPTLRGFANGRRLPDAAAELVTLTRWARAQAMGEGETYRLNLNPTTGEFWVSMEQGGQVRMIEASLGQVHRVPAGARLESDIAAEKGLFVVRFYPSGRSDAGVIRLVGLDETVEVVCPSAAENYRVVARGGA